MKRSETVFRPTLELWDFLDEFPARRRSKSALDWKESVFITRACYVVDDVPRLNVLDLVLCKAKSPTPCSAASGVALLDVTLTPGAPELTSKRNKNKTATRAT